MTGVQTCALPILQEDALFSGEYDAGDAVVTIQSDAGGTDAQDWTEILLRMYLRWAEQRGLKTEVIESSPGEEYGPKSATFTVRGENAYGILKAERGKHRLVRLSPFDQAHRRHTSFAQVIVAPLLEEAGVLGRDRGGTLLIIPEARLAELLLELGGARPQPIGVKGNHGPSRAGPRSPRAARRAGSVSRRAPWRPTS